MLEGIRAGNGREMLVGPPWRSQMFPISTPLLRLSLTASSTTQGVSVSLLSSLATLVLDSSFVSKGDCICSLLSRGSFGERGLVSSPGSFQPRVTAIIWLRLYLVLTLLSKAALGRGACSHLLVLSSHEWEHATAIISNQLEQPGPGLTTTREALWEQLLFIAYR